VQPLEWVEDGAGVLLVEAGAIIAHEVHEAPLPAQ